MKYTFTSPQVPVPDFLSGIEKAFELGWTDGLPVIPPTPERVEVFLDALGMDGDTVLGGIPERALLFTAEKVAIAAAMAGCRPEYMPVVAAAVRACSDPAFGLHGPSASTAGVAIMVIVNGPIANELGIVAGQNCLGTGNRANATIGRALRLLLINAGGSRIFDRSCFGHGGKFSMTLAEHEDTVWEPLHVQRGFDRDDSCVTVFAAEAPNQVINHFTARAEGLLEVIADRMRAMGSINMGGKQEMAVIIGPEHQQILLQGGFDSKEAVQEHLFRRARRKVREIYELGMIDDPSRLDLDGEIVAVPSPEHILLVNAGGVGRFSAVVPGWSGMETSRSVTVAIER